MGGSTNPGTNYVSTKGTLPSVCVCVCVCVSAVRELVKSGVSPDLYNEDGLTAMHQVNTHSHTHTSNVPQLTHLFINSKLPHRRYGMYNRVIVKA